MQGSINFPPLLVRSSQTDKAIADCDYQDGEEGAANARLIAAAPELLQALEDLQKAVHEYGLLDVRKRFSLCIADAQAGTAIHKARGNV